MKILSLEVHPVRLAFRVPFRTALGVKRESKNVWLFVNCEGGARGFGEASASLAMPGQTQENMARLLRDSERSIVGKEAEEWRRISKSLQPHFRGFPTALAALECALLDAACRARETSLSDFFGGRSASLETHYTISALEPRLCRRIARDAARKGFKKFKVKLTGKDLRADLERLRAAWEESGKTPVLVDANQCWTPSQCLDFLCRTFAAGICISYVEQPVARQDRAGLEFVARRSPFPIIADEAFRSLDDLRRLLDTEAAQGYNIKIAKLGLAASVEALPLIRRARKTAMIGCMMESAAGLAASVHWAAGSGGFGIVDLDSFLLLKEVPLRAGFKNKGPRLVADSCKGSGVQIPESLPRRLR